MTVPPSQVLLERSVRFFPVLNIALHLEFGGSYSLLDGFGRVRVQHERAFIFQIEPELVRIYHIPVLLELPLDKFYEHG